MTTGVAPAGQPLGGERAPTRDGRGKEPAPAPVPGATRGEPRGESPRERRADPNTQLRAPGRVPGKHRQPGASLVRQRLTVRRVHPAGALTREATRHYAPTGYAAVTTRTVSREHRAMRRPKPGRFDGGEVVAGERQTRQPVHRFVRAGVTMPRCFRRGERDQPPRAQPDHCWYPAGGV